VPKVEEGSFNSQERAVASLLAQSMELLASFVRGLGWPDANIGKSIMFDPWGPSFSRYPQARASAGRMIDRGRFKVMTIGKRIQYMQGLYRVSAITCMNGCHMSLRTKSKTFYQLRYQYLQSPQSA